MKICFVYYLLIKYVIHRHKIFSSICFVSLLLREQFYAKSLGTFFRQLRTGNKWIH